MHVPRETYGVINLGKAGPSTGLSSKSSGPGPPKGFEKYNGYEFREPHLHLYVEGYEDLWAILATDRGFIEPENLQHLSDNLVRFLDLCNIQGDLDIIGVLV